MTMLCYLLLTESRVSRNFFILMIGQVHVRYPSSRKPVKWKIFSSFWIRVSKSNSLINSLWKCKKKKKNTIYKTLILIQLSVVNSIFYTNPKLYFLFTFTVFYLIDGHIKQENELWVNYTAVPTGSNEQWSRTVHSNKRRAAIRIFSLPSSAVLRGWNSDSNKSQLHNCHAVISLEWFNFKWKPLRALYKWLRRRMVWDGKIWKLTILHQKISVLLQL